MPPAARAGLEAFLREQVSGLGRLPEEFCELCDHVPEYLDRCVERLGLDTLGLVGFSWSFCQLLPSLLLARHLKRLRPEVRIAFGGAALAGTAAEVLLTSYGFIDYVFAGEAEVSFPQAVRQLLDGREPEGCPGLHRLGADGEVLAWPPEPLEDLDQLPVPDYDDYDREVGRRRLPPEMPPFLLLEMARGCWWAARRRCVFCGFRGEEQPRFRRKSAQRLLDEHEVLARRHPRRRLAFSDANLLPEHYATVYPELARRQPDTWLYGELRPELTREQAQLLKAARFHFVQPGIESFSTPHLRLMRKGTTALTNVGCLKVLHEAGLEAKWHLLYGFPREQRSWLDDTLEVARCLTHLEPPLSVRHVLLLNNSRAFQDAEALGYLDVEPLPSHRWALRLEGEPLTALSVGFTFGYEDERDPEAYVAPLRELVDTWRSHARAGDLVHTTGGDGRGRIADTRFNAVSDGTELDPVEEAVYVLCDTPRSPRDVLEALPGRPGIDSDRVRSILESFRTRRWMVCEDDIHLSVARMGR